MEKIIVKKSAFQTTDGEIFYSRKTAIEHEYKQFKESIYEEFKIKIICSLGLTAKKLREMQEDCDSIEAFDIEVVSEAGLLDDNEELHAFFHDYDVESIDEFINLIIDLAGLRDGKINNVINQICRRKKELKKLGK